MAVLVLAGCAGSPAPEVVYPMVLCWSEQAVTPSHRSASEVSLAVNPLDPKHLVAAANSAGNFAIYTSLDGGSNWTWEDLEAVDLFGPAGTPTRLSDPSVAFSPDGTLHVAGLAIIPTSQVFVATRVKPEGPWQASTVWQSEVAGTMNDKEWLGVNQQTGTLLVAWQLEPLLDQLRGVETRTGGRADVDVGQIVVSRSTDGGTTWSLPEIVSESLHNNGTQIAFTVDGRAHLVWVDYEAPGLVHAISNDDGATWSAPAPISEVHVTGALGGFTRMHTLPGLAQSRDNLTVVWHDGRNTDVDVFVATYDGIAWSAAERVPDDEIDSGQIQFYPWATVDGSGVLHVTYYGGALDGNFTYREIRRTGTTWSAPTSISSPFPLIDGNGTAADIGDYTAAASGGPFVYAAWAQPGIEENAAVHVARMDLVPDCPLGHAMASSGIT